MKKQMRIFAILAAALLLMQAKAAISYTITASSFTPMDSICLGTQQSIDVKISGSYSSSDHLKVYIEHVGGPANLTVLLDSVFYTYFPSLPINGDGSRTIHFTMPISYLPGQFRICVNLGPSYAYGLFYSQCISGLEQYSAPVHVIGMYDVMGNPVTEKRGLVIIFYSNGSRKKVLYGGVH